jgi:hypothetical protein
LYALGTWDALEALGALGADITLWALLPCWTCGTWETLYALRAKETCWTLGTQLTLWARLPWRALRTLWALNAWYTWLTLGALGTWRSLWRRTRRGRAWRARNRRTNLSLRRA